jgi:hypothetical protein
MTSVSVSEANRMPSASSSRRSLLVVLDDTVVHDHDTLVHTHMGMSVALAGPAVRRPTRMADADVTPAVANRSASPQGSSTCRHRGG